MTTFTPDLLAHPDASDFLRDECLGVAIWTPVLTTKAPSRAIHLADAPNVFIFTGQGWLANFVSYVESLTSLERRTIVATELTSDHRYVPWRGVSLEQMAARLRAPWLPAVLDEARIFTHFQPIADSQSGGLYGYEALARTIVDDNTKNGGEILEAARAHNKLGHFDSVARNCAVQSAGMTFGDAERLFINVMPSTIANPDEDLTEFWDTALTSGIAPNRIILEILESDEMQDRDALRNFVSHVRSRGALIALDDVGAGHSSLVHIEELKPDLVKFDRGLLPLNPTDRDESLLIGLNDFCHGHGCLTVAEGVENERQLAMIRECGFDLAQGWLIGRPKPPKLNRIGARK